MFEERWGRAPVAMRTIAPGRADDPAFRRWYARVQRYSASPGSAIAWYRFSGEIDVRRVLPTIRVPTLVLHRAGDMIVPVEHGRYLAAQIPGAKYVELPGEEHFWFDGDSEAILAEIQEFLTGVRPVPVSDRVLLTVLFTDIVDSTRLAADLGDRGWRDLLEQHHRVVRAALERFRGREIDTAGDGFLAVFDGPARAIRCARAVVAAVRDLGLEIRVGVHTGECEVIGEAVAGLAVHIGARVAALAAPERGPRVEHGQGPGGRIGISVRSTGPARAEGRAGRVASLRRGPGAPRVARSQKGESSCRSRPRPMIQPSG